MDLGERTDCPSLSHSLFFSFAVILLVVLYISKWDFVFLLLVKFQRGDGGRKCGNGSRKENIGN